MANATASSPVSAAPALAAAKSWGLWLALAALIVVCLLPTPQGLPVAGQYMVGLLLFAVILWVTEAVDYAISAVMITALMAFLLGLAPNVAKPDAVLGTSAALTLALGGFANTALALVAAALFLSAAMTVTGLDKRRRCGSCRRSVRARDVWALCCRSLCRVRPRGWHVWCRSSWASFSPSAWISTAVSPAC